MMEGQPDNTQRFSSNYEFWIGEIRGDIALLNDAASAVEVDIAIPTSTNDINTTQHKIEKIRKFQVTFRTLFRNAKQIIPEDIATKITRWFDATVKEGAITDPVLLKYGLQLIDELQDVFFDIGVKDIDLTDPVVFPYKFYEGLDNAST